MYGSMATGLALETSDLDIAIRGIEIYTKEKLISCMNSFCNQIEKCAYVEQCKCIATARVPVIKMVICDA